MLTIFRYSFRAQSSHFDSRFFFFPYMFSTFAQLNYSFLRELVKKQTPSPKTMTGCSNVKSDAVRVSSGAPSADTAPGCSDSDAVRVSSGAPSADTAPGPAGGAGPVPAFFFHVDVERGAPPRAKLIPAPVPISLNSWGAKWEGPTAPSWQCENVNGVLTRVIPHDQLKGRVFVPLCGASVDLLWLAQLDAVTEVIGIEFSKAAVVKLAEETLKPAGIVEEAEVRFVTEQLPPREAWKQDEVGADGVVAADFSDSVEVLWCGKISVYVADFFHPGLRVLFGGKFDVVYDRASLVAINLEDQEKYVERMWEWTVVAARYFLVGLEYERGLLRTCPPRIIADEEVGVLFGGGGGHHAGGRKRAGGTRKWDIEPLEKDSVDHELTKRWREMGLVIRQHVYGMRKRAVRFDV